MYRRRLLEDKLHQLQRLFKTVLVVGARQVGKSTLLTHCFPDYKHITFNPLIDTLGAKTDPIRFLNNHAPPLILDEIQYCPELLAMLKVYVDQSSEKGRYLLTGSQNFSMMKNVSESMAGRIAILQLDAFSIDEITGETQHFLPHYLQNPTELFNRYSHNLALKNTLYEYIWRGCMPEIMSFENTAVQDYMLSYLQTYIERDVRLLENIQNIREFERFVRLTAALTAQEINYTQLGRELGISRITATKWLNILKIAYQWRELPAFDGNAIKRIARKSKGYWHDTGLACYLLFISSPDALASHPMLGNLFENFITTNLLKVANTIPFSSVYHWRTQAGAEVDLIFERDGKLFPIEIKCKGSLNKHDARGIQAFCETYSHKNIAPGVIIYAGNECYELTEHVIAVPWNAVFK